MIRFHRHRLDDILFDFGLTVGATYDLPSGHILTIRGAEETRVTFMIADAPASRQGPAGAAPEPRTRSKDADWKLKVFDR